MGRTRTAIESMLADLKAYVEDNFADDPLIMPKTIVYEAYRELPEDLEPRQNVPRARIALYTDSEELSVAVGYKRAADSNQTFGIDISVVKAYRGDDAHNAELAAEDLRDIILDWSNQVDPFQVTSGAVADFEYGGATGFTRRPRFVTKTMRFVSFRDLLKKQYEAKAAS